MRDRTLQLAGILAMLAVIGKYYAVPVLAQVRAALVQNRDEPARNFYAHSLECTGGISCVVTFPTVPAGKRLVIQHLNADHDLVTSNRVVSVRLANQVQTTYYTATLAGFRNALYEWITNESILLNVEAGPLRVSKP